MHTLTIPTEPVGSIPRPLELIEAVRAHERGEIHRAALDALFDGAIVDTLQRFEATGSPVISDGERRKHHNFATYCVHGAPNLAPDGSKLQFVDHFRQWPRLTAGPFRYLHRGDDYLAYALKHSRCAVKQAVISPSALSLFYPPQDLPDYPRDRFIADLVDQCESEIRACLALGAPTVQVDFTEGRLAHKLDPTGALLESFVELNNMALRRFSDGERQRIGIHTCPGATCCS